MSTSTAEEVRRSSVLRGTTEVLLGTALAAALSALLLKALVDGSDAFLPFQPGPVVFATAVGVLAGLGVLLLLRRFGRERLFAPLVVVGTLLSLGGPISLLGATPAEQPGVTDAAALALVPLHLLVGAAVAFVLPRRTR